MNLNYKILYSLKNGNHYLGFQRDIIFLLVEGLRASTLVVIK